MEQEIINAVEARPFPNEHSCRLKPPNYPKYARKNCYKKHEGKCIDYIFGVISPDESELQAMRYPKDIWTADAARAHCKDAGGSFEAAKEEESDTSKEMRMAITVNSKGVAHAKSLIAAGKINEGAWSFSSADGNALLGDNDWAEYGRWFLAVDSDADPETKDHFKYPFGKKGEIYRRGVIAAKQRATAQGLTAMADAADGLLTAIDKKLGKEEESIETVERRFLPIGEMRVAKGDNGSMIIEGYPILYEVYASLWGFREIIRKGAATEALKHADELVLWDHESSLPMARRSAGTLEAKEDEKGVFIRADVSKTIWGRNGYEAILNGVINRMSFAFVIDKDQWSWEGEGDQRIEVREILSFANIYDYSPVSYPAYKETIVSARARALAIRNRPQLEASSEADAAASEESAKTRDAIARERIVRSYLFRKE